MSLAPAVVVLLVVAVFLFAIICGLGAAMLTRWQGHSVAMSACAGFAAAATTVLLCCAVAGMVADLS
ncbi:hypothetical protein ABZ413_17380 [Nocardia rhamnosiphila]|uniref:hypothetical protein n=1 Tax=Nocardia rhamnosiphila TaxID=426716 RepID=UPI0033C387A6